MLDELPTSTESPRRPIRRRVLIIVAALAAAITVTVVAVRLPGGSVDPADQLLGRTFESTGLVENGQPKELADDTVVWVELYRNGRIEANAGCNTKEAAVDIDNGRLQAPRGWITTDAGCASAALTSQDEWLMAFFMAGPSWRLDGDTLVLATDATTITLADTGEPAGPDAVPPMFRQP